MIPEKYIQNMINRLHNRKLPLHSLLILQNDTLVAEEYFYPCKKDDLHRVFSIAKTFVAIGIGLCEEEGLLNRQDKILSYFPEYEKEDTHPWIREMTIENMLMMRTCHATTTYKHNADLDWIESFFTVTPTHKPGTIFHYDTSSAHVLCALVERLTHRNCLDYIKEKLSSLHFSKESYLLKDPFGHSHGGSGLMATSMDLMKLGYFLLKEGNIGGIQLLSKEYIKLATSNLTSTRVTAGIPAEAQGYGYMIWRHERNGFTCYGMGGQLVIVCPNQNMICVTTADTQGMAGGNQLIYDAFFEEILDKTEGTSQDVSSTFCGTFPEDYCHRVYELQDNKSGFLRMEIKKREDDFCLRIYTADSTHEIAFGLEELKKGTLCSYDTYGTATLLDPSTLYIRCNLMDTCLGSLHFQLFFEETELTVFIKKVEESLFGEFNGHFHGKRITL